MLEVAGSPKDSLGQLTPDAVQHRTALGLDGICVSLCTLLLATKKIHWGGGGGCKQTNSKSLNKTSV